MSERAPGPYELRGDLILLNGMTHARFWHPSDRATHERTVDLLNKGTHYDALVGLLENIAHRRRNHYFGGGHGDPYNAFDVDLEAIETHIAAATGKGVNG